MANKRTKAHYNGQTHPEVFIANPLTYWLSVCSAPGCSGYTIGLKPEYTECKTCGGRDLMPIPLTELYSPDAFYLYKNRFAKKV